MDDLLCEVCVDSVASARAAVAGGADRLELCQALPVGGLTPTTALLSAVRKLARNIPVFAMLRPRAGDFVVDPDELRLVVDELRALRGAGADGFVFGALTVTGKLDAPAVARVVDAAGALPVTFHRAFDQIQDPALAWRELGALGIARVLTSGGAAVARDGASRIAGWAAQGGPRPLVGGGVRPSNVVETLQRSGADEYHLSGGRIVGTPLRPVGVTRRLAPETGSARIGGGYLGDHQRFVCDGDLVAATRDAVAQAGLTRGGSVND